METRIIFCLVSILLLASCEKEQQLSLPGQDIYGNWTEVEPQGIAQFEGNTFTYLTLHQDQTFQITYKGWTDIVTQDDPCPNIHDYYMKGTFSMTADSIFLDGCYAGADHRSCVGRCDGKVDFKDRYEYILTPDSLILNPRMDIIFQRKMIIR